MESPIERKLKAQGLPKRAKEPKAPTNKSPSVPKSRGHRKHHRAKTEGIENLRNDDSNVPHSSKNAKGGVALREQKHRALAVVGHPEQTK